MKALALPTKVASAQFAVRFLSTAKEYRESNTATALRPYRVIPNIRPTAQELKNGPGINATGARKRHAAKPKRYTSRDPVPVIRRTTVPASAATASNTMGRTTK